MPPSQDRFLPKTTTKKIKIKVLKSKNMDKNLIIAIYTFNINLLLGTWFCGPKINIEWSLQDFIGH